MTFTTFVSNRAHLFRAKRTSNRIRFSTFIRFDEHC